MLPYVIKILFFIIKILFLFLLFFFLPVFSLSLSLSSSSCRPSARSLSSSKSAKKTQCKLIRRFRLKRGFLLNRRLQAPSLFRRFRSNRGLEDGIAETKSQRRRLQAPSLFRRFRIVHPSQISKPPLERTKSSSASSPGSANSDLR
jgi:hypothetical protein